MKKVLMIVCILLSLSGCTSDEGINNRIIIDKININSEYSLVGLNDEVIGIVMYDECGRPNIEGSNTVIGAHSGIGNNALFNDISKLERGDEITIIYDNYSYIYVVNDIRIISDTDIDVLKNNGKSILTLLTCKFGEVDKRIIVVSELMVDL